MKKITDIRAFRIAGFSMMIVAAIALLFRSPITKAVLFIFFALYIIFVAINGIIAYKEKNKK